MRDLARQPLNAHAQTPRGSLPLTGKGRHQRRSKVKSARNRGSVQCGSSSRALGGLWSVLLGNFRPYSSRVVAVAVIHGWYYFQLYCSYK